MTNPEEVKPFAAQERRQLLKDAGAAAYLCLELRVIAKLDLVLRSAMGLFELELF